MSRLKEAQEKLDVERLNLHYEKYRYFIESIQKFISSSTEIEPILSVQRKGLESLLKLQVFSEHYPFPGSTKYDLILTYIQHNLGDYPFIWFILIFWNDLHLLGRLITQEESSVEICKSWLEEWSILRVIEERLFDLGFDRGQAQGGVSILKLLTSQQNWVGRVEGKSPLAIMQMWLSDGEVREFLSVNRYQGKLWFNKEAFESMMWWMMTIALVQLMTDPDKSLTEVIEILFDRYERIQIILDAEIDSEYQVSKLLEGLK